MVAGRVAFFACPSKGLPQKFLVQACGKGHLVRMTKIRHLFERMLKPPRQTEESEDFARLAPARLSSRTPMEQNVLSPTRVCGGARAVFSF